MIFAKDDIKLNADFPFDYIDYIIQPSSELAFHWHDCLEISCVKEGRGRYVVSGREYTMEAGDVILFNSVEPHAWQAFPGNAMHQPVIVFNPSLIWSGESNLFDYQYLKPFTERSTNFSNKLPGNHPGTAEIFRLIMDIEREFTSRQTGYRLMIKARLLQIITNLIRCFQDEEKVSEDIPQKKEHLQRLQSVIEFINKNYLRDIRLADAAALAYMNPNYFSTFFSNAMGVTFKEYVIKLRLNHASSLLRQGNMPVTEAASASGFNSLSNYYKACNKFLGK